MDQKTKLIIIGLIGFSVVCLFLFMQATSSQQMLTRERNDLKSENATLISKVDRIESDLKANQVKIASLQDEKAKAIQDINDLQKKLDLVNRSRDELVERLKSQRKEEVSGAGQQETAPQDTDAYWGRILKAKTDLELQLSSIQGELKSLQASNESLQRDKSVLEIDINSLRNEKQDLLRQLDYNQKLLDSISQDVVRERNDKVAIQESFKAIKAENKVLSRQLKNLNSHKADLDKKIQDLQEGKSAIEKRLSEMETMLTERVSQVNSLKEDLDAIRSGKPVADLDKKFKESVELPAIVVRSSSPIEKTETGAAAFPGKVLAVNLDNNFVVIDLGSSSGMKSGDRFSVYRDGKQIGSIEVIQVRDNISACDIKRMSTPLKTGDNIK
jgi:chromosome segregation ATPase